MKKFRDMTDSEKLEIINAMIAGEKVEALCIDKKWRAMIQPESISFDGQYRIQKRPMTIDWSVLKDGYICAAIDKCCFAFAYQAKPEKGALGWCTGGDAVCLNGLKSYDPGTVDWQDSLIWRPGYGDNK